MAITPVFAWPGSMPLSPPEGTTPLPVDASLAATAYEQSPPPRRTRVAQVSAGLGVRAECRLAAGPEVWICTDGATPCGEVLAQPAGGLRG
ncbi:hypothetical protein [Streptomyces canus]|uniref:hypothetical protein n=1 Tax=Streptomyces canus TaxID=58343 RepID=UPI00370FFC75